MASVAKIIDNSLAKLREEYSVPKGFRRTKSGRGILGNYGFSKHNPLTSSVAGRLVLDPSRKIWKEIKNSVGVKKVYNTRKAALKSRLNRYNSMKRKNDPLAKYFKRSVKNRNLRPSRNGSGSSALISAKDWELIESLRNAKYELDPQLAEKYLKDVDPERYEKIKQKLESYYMMHGDELDPEMSEEERKERMDAILMTALRR